MSPTPLIELQRRLAEAGRIRMGEKGDKGQPQRLTTFRITSPMEDLIRQAAELYGGEPKPWDSPTGKQFEVVTTSEDLPVLVMPAYSFRQGYEFRTSPTLVERRCDGVEQQDGSPCMCNAEGFTGKDCDLLTRLTVALPELTTMLGWRLETKGDNAARELLASMDLVQGVAGGRPFIPAKLRIVERRGNVGGQAVRYVVPVIDVSVRYAEILGGESLRELALPAGYTPIPKTNGSDLSLEQGLEVAETQQLTKPPRVQLPEDDDILDEDPGASPLGDGATSPAPAATAPQEPLAGGTEPATAADDIPPARPLTLVQTKKKMDAIVATLRKERAITTMQLWSAVASARSSDERRVDVELMIESLGGRDDDGLLHWGPLRDSLTLEEARALHGRLARLYASTREPVA